MNDQVTDYLIETETGYKLDHLYCQFNEVQPTDLPMLQGVIDTRSEAAKTAISQGRYDLAVMLLAPKYRASALADYAGKGLIKPCIAWKIAREAWLETVNVYPSIEGWEAFFALNLPDSHYFMSEKERHHLSLMPDDIQIYRGYEKKSGRKGISWTLSKMIASQYAYRFKALKMAQGIIKKTDVIGYINTRGHHEIVVRSRESLTYYRSINVVRPKSGLIFNGGRRRKVNIQDSMHLAELTEIDNKSLVNE